MGMRWRDAQAVMKHKNAKMLSQDSRASIRRNQDIRTGFPSWHVDPPVECAATIEQRPIGR
jgi:hypothetical protein